MVNSRKVVALFLVSVFICGVILSLSSSQAQPRASNSLLPSTAATASDYAHLTKVTRSISIGQYLLTNVYDTYTIRNDGLSALASFEILTDSVYDSKLVYLGATGGSGETLPLSKSPVTTNGYVTYDLLLSEPIAPGDSQSITVSTCYYNLTSTSGDSSTQSCSFQFGIYPISHYSIDSFECDLYLPQTATSPTFTPQPPTTGTTSATWTQPNVPAFSSTTLTATFTYSDAPILQMNSIARRIIVDPWGMVTVQEDHVICNTGQIPVTTYNFRIPLNATNFTITDAFEAVSGSSVSSTTNWDGKTVNVTVSLTTNRAPLLAGDTFRYTISYQLPFSMFASESWNNYYCFLQAFPTQMDFLIVSETTQIILSAGYSVTSVSPNPASTLIEGMQTTLTFSDSMVSPLQQRVVQISYQV
ncbi:MAG TPA: hypothetical protein VKK79_13650, partial [Candidatus Lokiarchaeia archaeon]|nr:hypothetical protein [Candidatus Lokiarchaeia archaeon]